MSSLSPTPAPLTPLTDVEREAVRALFSDHLEGALDDADRARVDAALARDDALRVEHAALSQTLSLLRGLPRAEAPADLVGRVRDRLANERRQSLASPESPLSSSTSSPTSSPGAQVVSFAEAQARRRSRVVEVVAGLAAVAAVFAVVTVGVPALRGDAESGGLLTAGASATQAVELSWRAPGLDVAVVAVAAKDAGLAADANGAFVGDRQAAARFLIALKTRAASSGSDVSGYVPESAEHVVIRVLP